MEFYYFLNCFFVYSFFGWCFECLVMSYEEKKVVNRGFIKGPLCTIYGVGALSMYFLLQPISNNKFMVFLVGALLATILEIVVALLMTKLFGYFWWNYNNKKFNFKGVICLESSVCWGVMTLLVFILFQPTVEYIVNSYYYMTGKLVACIILVAYCVDFYISFHKAFDDKEKRLSDNSANYSRLTINDFWKVKKNDF